MHYLVVGNCINNGTERRNNGARCRARFVPTHTTPVALRPWARAAQLNRVQLNIANQLPILIPIDYCTVLYSRRQITLRPSLPHSLGSLVEIKEGKDHENDSPKEEHRLFRNARGQHAPSNHGHRGTERVS